MFLATINFLDIAIFVVRQLLIIGVLYFAVFFLIRSSGYYKLNKCPECGNKLKRSSRGSAEHLAKKFSFGILPLKRYRCYSCYWEGAAFQIPKSEHGQSTKEDEGVIKEETVNGDES